MARPYLTDDLESAEPKRIMARPAIPIISPAPAPAAAPAQAPQPQPNLFPDLAGSPSFTGNSVNNLPLPGGPAPQPTLNPMSTATPAEMAAVDPNSAQNVQRRMSSPLVSVSGPEQDAARMLSRQGVVNSANTGGSYANAVSPGGFGLTPQQAVGMGFVPPPVTRTAPNLAYGGAPIGSTQFFGGPSKDAAGVPLQPGQRADESADQFGQRRRDIASMNMENADLGVRRSDARQSRQLLSNAANKLAAAGDTESAAALLSQAASTKVPSRATPYTVARTREDDVTKRTVGVNDPRTFQSQEATRRAEMVQSMMNDRQQRELDFKQMSENGRRLSAPISKEIDRINNQIVQQSRYFGGPTDAKARAEVAKLQGQLEDATNRYNQIYTADTQKPAPKRPGLLEKLFGNNQTTTSGGGDGKTPETAVRPASPADAAKLPGGTYFYDDKGVLRQRPLN